MTDVLQTNGCDLLLLLESVQRTDPSSTLSFMLMCSYVLCSLNCVYICSGSPGGRRSEAWCPLTIVKKKKDILLSLTWTWAELMMLW